MKRTILMLLFLIIFSNVSYAQEDERWVNIYQEKDGTSAYLDSKTVKAYISDNGAIYIECWVKTSFPNNLNIKYTIDHNYFKLSKTNSNPYLRSEMLFFDSNGNTMQQSDYNSKGWMFPVPNSVFEKVIENTFIWVSENSKDRNIPIGYVGPTTNIDE